MVMTISQRMSSFQFLIFYSENKNKNFLEVKLNKSSRPVPRGGWKSSWAQDQYPVEVGSQVGLKTSTPWRLEVKLGLSESVIAIPTIFVLLVADLDFLTIYIYYKLGRINTSFKSCLENLKQHI